MTSGPYTIKWHVVLPLCLELLVPVVIWALLLESIYRFSRVKLYKLNVKAAIIVQMPNFFWLFVTLVWLFCMEGWNFANQ
jgi:hypothetical protein